jgi:hypothetical protein
VHSSLRLLPFRKQILFHWNQKKPLSTCSSSIASFKCRASTVSNLSYCLPVVFFFFLV